MDFQKDQVVILNGGVEYIVLDTTIYESNKYLLLSKLNDAKITVVKVEKRDNDIGLAKLSDEEYQNVLLQFNDQNR